MVENDYSPLNHEYRLHAISALEVTCIKIMYARMLSTKQLELLWLAATRVLPQLTLHNCVVCTRSSETILTRAHVIFPAYVTYTNILRCFTKFCALNKVISDFAVFLL